MNYSDVVIPWPRPIKSIGTDWPTPGIIYLADTRWMCTRECQGYGRCEGDGTVYDGGACVVPSVGNQSWGAIWCEKCIDAHQKLIEKDKPKSISRECPCGIFRGDCDYHR